jgi:hypothetical protein
VCHSGQRTFSKQCSQERRPGQRRTGRGPAQRWCRSLCTPQPARARVAHPAHPAARAARANHAREDPPGKLSQVRASATVRGSRAAATWRYAPARPFERRRRCRLAASAIAWLVSPPERRAARPTGRERAAARTPGHRHERSRTAAVAGVLLDRCLCIAKAGAGSRSVPSPTRVWCRLPGNTYGDWEESSGRA